MTIRAPDNSIIYANRAAREDMGFETVEELRSRNPRALMDDYIVTDETGRELHLDDLPSVRLLRGEPAEPLLLHSVSRSGGHVGWRLLKAALLRDQEGEVIAAVTVIENVTAVKSAELRMRVLAESGRLLASSLDYQRTLSNVANVAVPTLADLCMVDLVDERLRRQNVAIAHRDPDRAELAARLHQLEPDELDPGRALTRVLTTGVAELYDEVTDERLRQAARSAEELELLRALEMRSVAIVPMRVPRRILGVMTMVTAESRRRLTVEDLALAEQLGRRAAVAVENARMHTTLSDIAETLQRSLLPDKPPEVPDWDVAALYRPSGAGDRLDVGGDFYDVFDTDEGWLALIGDVAGKGVNAAAMTSLMRSGARFTSRFEPRPVSILARLNEFLTDRGGISLCTVLCARLGVAEVTLSSAGHPPAIIVAPGGAIRETPTSGPLLGAFSDPQWPEELVSIERDELMLMYTDGVTETAGRQGRFGTARLRALLGDHAGSSPTELLRRLDRALEDFSGGSRRDDVAALALRPK